MRTKTAIFHERDFNIANILMDEERYQYETILLITESLFKEQHKSLITAFWDLKEVNIAPEFPFYHQNCVRKYFC